MDQGTRISCFYCTKIKSDPPDPNCRICGGQITYFRAARMMDRETSDVQILYRIIEMFRMIFENDLSINEFYADPKSNFELMSTIEGLMEQFTIYSTNIEDIFTRILQRS